MNATAHRLWSESPDTPPLRYLVRGSADERDVLQFIRRIAPCEFAGLLPTCVRIEPTIEPRSFLATIEYGA